LIQSPDKALDKDKAQAQEQVCKALAVLADKALADKVALLAEQALDKDKAQALDKVVLLAEQALDMQASASASVSAQMIHKQKIPYLKSENMN
jgi:anti-sigma factor ChrR (cupin superfamily)